MISRYEVTLNGLPLSGINSNILITDIQYNAAKFSDETYNVAKRHGSRIWRRAYKSASVKIQFAIRAYSISERQAICAAIVKWAKDGGELQCNDRPNQRLRCVCTEFPYIGSALGWTETLSMTFTAYVVPFWEEVIPTVVSLNSNGTSWRGDNAYVPGNIDVALVETTINTLEAVTTDDADAINLETMLVVGPSNYESYTSMTIKGKAMSANKKIELKYDESMIQSITYIASSSSKTSLIPYRTGNTDLLAKCGHNFRFRFKAKKESTATFSVRGLWL